METLVLSMNFDDDPDDVEAWANGLVGNLAPSNENYIVDKVLSISVVWTGGYFVAFVVAEVSLA